MAKVSQIKGYILTIGYIIQCKKYKYKMCCVMEQVISNKQQSFLSWHLLFPKSLSDSGTLLIDIVTINKLFYINEWETIL